MKQLTTIALLLLSACFFGQAPLSDTSIFSIQKIEFTTKKFNGYLLGNTDKSPKMLFNDALNEFEFDTGTDNLWIKFKMPVDFIPLSQSTSVINLDSSEAEELIVKGLVKVFDGNDSLIQKTLLIFQLSKVPMLIFQLNYGCITLKNYKDTYTVWQMDDNCDLSVEIENNKIVVSRLDNSNLTCCKISNIEVGNYILMDGQITKSK
jgi:hypothetical protein